MNFLFDVYVECEICLGCCYNCEIFEILYKGKFINDVLEMLVIEVVEFFEYIFKIFCKFKILKEVGLGYIIFG